MFITSQQCNYYVNNECNSDFVNGRTMHPSPNPAHLFRQPQGAGLSSDHPTWVLARWPRAPKGDLTVGAWEALPGKGRGGKRTQDLEWTQGNTPPINTSKAIQFCWEGPPRNKEVSCRSPSDTQNCRRGRLRRLSLPPPSATALWGFWRVSMHRVGGWTETAASFPYKTSVPRL